MIEVNRTKTGKGREKRGREEREEKDWEEPCEEDTSTLLLGPQMRV